MALAHHYLPLKYLGHHRCMWSVGYSGGVFPNKTILSFFSKQQQFPLPSQCEEEDTTSFVHQHLGIYQKKFLLNLNNKNHTDDLP